MVIAVEFVRAGDRVVFETPSHDYTVVYTYVKVAADGAENDKIVHGDDSGHVHVYPYGQLVNVNPANDQATDRRVLGLEIARYRQVLESEVTQYRTQVQALRRELTEAYAEMSKIRPVIRAIFNQEVWDRIDRIIPNGDE